MSELYKFMSENRGPVCLIVLMIGWVITDVAKRWTRHRNIVSAGWPPFHLDADGETRILDDDDIAAAKASTHSSAERGGAA